MSNETFHDLLIINVDKVNVEHFQADHSIELWWKAKTRRPNQQPRKTYRKKQSGDHEDTTSSDTDSESGDNHLEDWDSWMDNYAL